MIDPDFDWPDPGQAWADLPATVRAEMVAAGAAEWKRIFDGRASYNKQWRLARPPVMTGAAFTALNEVCDRVAQLILEACQRRARTAGELRRLFNEPVGRTSLLDDDEVLSEALLAAYRPDVLLSGGVPRFVEYNIDSSLGGGYDADTVVYRFAELYQEQGILDGLGLRPAPSVIDQRFVAIRDTLGLADGARVALLLDFDADYPGLEDPEYFIRLLDPVAERAKAFGMDLIIRPVGETTVDDQNRIIVDGGTVDALFRLFVPNRVSRGPGLDAVATALKAGTLPMYVSAAAWLLGNKMIFAWLWEDADSLPEADRKLIHRYVPRTERLTAASLERALAEQHDLVAKPADGSAGIGVLIGRETDPQAWRDGVLAGIESGDHILQEYCSTDTMPMDFVQIETGETTSAEVPYSIAPYIFDRHSSGALFRVGFPGCQGVLNLSKGVLLTGVLVTD